MVVIIMEQFKCEECQRDFASQESLNQHNMVKHRIGLQPKKELNQIKKQEKVWITKKTILKYAVVAIIILIPLGFLIHHFSSSSAKTTNQINGMSASKVALGTKAPDFTLPSTTGKSISLSDYRGKKNVLLYFQEGVMCDPCWQQTLDIQKVYDKFQSKGIELLTITVDPLNALTKNAQKFGITLPVLADENLKVSTAYDVLKDSMHPGSRPGHTFVLVDKEGNIVWRKAYFLASGSTKMTMKMGSQVMTMDMGMDMGTPDSVMYLPVERLLADMNNVKLESTVAGSEMKMSDPNMTMQDHSMCLTPIHFHADFKMYLGGVMLNFSQNNYMDQSNEFHFHKTVKVKPDDVPNVPNGLLIHIHREGITLIEFLKTLDMPFDAAAIENLKVYVNGNIQKSGLDYVMEDKDRILITNSIDDAQIKAQVGSVTDYALQGKEKNPSLFGGC